MDPLQGGFTKSMSWLLPGILVVAGKDEGQTTGAAGTGKDRTHGQCRRRRLERIGWPAWIGWPARRGAVGAERPTRRGATTGGLQGQGRRRAVKIGACRHRQVVVWTGVV